MDSMKIAVMSDTHGNVRMAVNALKKVERIDRLIHLGDHYQDAMEMGKKIGVSIEAVAGNTDTDAYPSVSREKIIELDRIRIFITHGDIYKVKQGIDCLLEKAIEENAQVVLFGHTHFPLKQRIGKILFVNPGCVLPNNSHNSFALLNISKGKIKAELIPL